MFGLNKSSDSRVLLDWSDIKWKVIEEPISKPDQIIHTGITVLTTKTALMPIHIGERKRET